MSQDALKQAAAAAALELVRDDITRDTILGIGTGSTANCLIDLLRDDGVQFRGAVPSSVETERRLRALGIDIFELNDINELSIYIDGADEVNPNLEMIKGGGAALTREKIVASVAKRFICIADASKEVPILGTFPLPVEVIPMARSSVARALVKLGGQPVYRQGVLTDNGNVILDVHHLSITEPKILESQINQIVGVVTNGLFAHRSADDLILATPSGVEHHRGLLKRP